MIVVELNDKLVVSLLACSALITFCGLLAVCHESNTQAESAALNSPSQIMTMPPILISTYISQKQNNLTIG